MSRRQLASAARQDLEPPASRALRLTLLAEEPPPASAAGPPGPDVELAPAPRPAVADPAPGVRRGPLLALAVCGCCGGVGASTLAYLVALAAARSRSEPVLVADTGGTGGGLAYYTGVVAPHSLAEIAESLAAGMVPGRPFATASDGLRVLATGPRFAAGCTSEGVELLLDDARVAHSLTVVDCGTLTREADQIALANASHIAWVLPATHSGVRRASRMLEAIDPQMRGRELVVARRDEREAKAALAHLKQIASARHAPLILVPHLPDLDRGNADEALETAQVSLQAIRGVLER